MGTFELIATRSIIVKEGWGVDVCPIYYDNEVVSEIVVSVVEISPKTVAEVGETWVVPVPNSVGYNIPVENFKELEDLTQDDTHDLRTRWFATQEEARNWAQHVEETWKNPEPWRIFVCLQ